MMERTLKQSWKRIAILSIVAALLIGCVFSSEAASGTISKSKAQEIALKTAKVRKSSVLKFTESKLDNKGGEWDIEFYTSKHYYDVELSAKKGKVKHYKKTSYKVSQSAAKKKALKAAKIKSSSVKKWTLADLDGKEWDLKFQTGTYKYEVEINARTGHVSELSKSKIKKMISKNTAKKKALAKAGVKSSSVKKWTRVVLDGNEYDINFQTRSHKYEVEVNAYSGRIRDYHKKAISSGKGDISISKAKSIALAHAKKNANIRGKVRYIKAEKDWDHGVYVYEIEFYNKGMEFSYEINPKNGKIIEWDIDYDD